MLSLGSWLFTILFLYLLCKIIQYGDFYFLFLGDELDIFPYELNYINKLFGKGGKEARNIIYKKGGKEVRIQNINPKMLKIHCCKLWNQPPHQKKKKKKKDYKAIME